MSDTNRTIMDLEHKNDLLRELVEILKYRFAPRRSGLSRVAYAERQLKLREMKHRQAEIEKELES